MRSVMMAIACAALPGLVAAQSGGDPDKLVKDGGVQVPGWTGRLDPAAEKRGAKITDARLWSMGPGMHVTAGPPAIYWNPTNTATGTYTAKATFAQTKAPEHAEYYGMFIGGTNLDKPGQNYLYCAISGNGTFVVKHRLGDEVHELAGRTAHAAIRQADAAGKASNEVAWKVTPERTSCLVNGTEVWGYASKDLVGPGKLESTDGIAGIRVNHNLDVHIGGFGLAKQ